MRRLPLPRFTGHRIAHLRKALTCAGIAICACALFGPLEARATKATEEGASSNVGPIANDDAEYDFRLEPLAGVAAGSSSEDSRSWSLPADGDLTGRAELVEGRPSITRDPETVKDRPEFEFWVVSSREVRGSLPEPFQSPPLRCLRFTGHGNPEQVDLEDFLKGFDRSTATIIYVHGNRVGSLEAEAVGRRVLEVLSSHVPAEGTYRFVLWSWPSSRIAGVIKDARVKARRSDVHSFHLAWVMDHVPGDVRVSLLGYSYGARLITGTLHLLGGGSLVGRELPLRDDSEAVHLRVTLIAAALDNHWLLPGKRNGRALSQVERLLVLNNSRDPVLKRYPWVDPRHGSKALGYTGLSAPWRIGRERAKVDQIDVRHSVGVAHNEKRYLHSKAFLAHLSNYVFFGDDQGLHARAPSG